MPSITVLELLGLNSDWYSGCYGMKYVALSFQSSLAFNVTPCPKKSNFHKYGHFIGSRYLFPMGDMVKVIYWIYHKDYNTLLKILSRGWNDGTPVGLLPCAQLTKDRLQFDPLVYHMVPQSRSSF